MSSRASSIILAASARAKMGFEFIKQGVLVSSAIGAMTSLAPLCIYIHTNARKSVFMGLSPIMGEGG